MQAQSRHVPQLAMSCPVRYECRLQQSGSAVSRETRTQGRHRGQEPGMQLRSQPRSPIPALPPSSPCSALRSRAERGEHVSHSVANQTSAAEAPNPLHAVSLISSPPRAAPRAQGRPRTPHTRHDGGSGWRAEWGLCRSTAVPSGAQQMGRGRGASLITSLRWIYLFFFFF